MGLRGGAVDFVFAVWNPPRVFCVENPMKKLTTLLLCILVVAACEKDEFSSAPSVTAPKAEGVAPVVPTADSNMPANHPPTGGQAMPMAQAAQPVKFGSVAEFGKTGPLRWTAPEGWTAAMPASTMRLAEYTVPPADGSQPGELSIFYFGPGGGGGVEANVQRWIGQFKGADGATAAATQSVETVNGMKVHRVGASGTYNAGMAGNGVPRENHRMLGAIVETSVGLYFFKLVGPADTVEARQAEFESFVKSFSPGT